MPCLNKIAPDFQHTFFHLILDITNHCMTGDDHPQAYQLDNLLGIIQSNPGP